VLPPAEHVHVMSLHVVEIQNTENLKCGGSADPPNVIARWNEARTFVRSTDSSWHAKYRPKYLVGRSRVFHHPENKRHSNTPRVEGNTGPHWAHQGRVGRPHLVTPGPAASINTMTCIFLSGLHPLLPLVLTFVLLYSKCLKWNLIHMTNLSLGI